MGSRGQEAAARPIVSTVRLEKVKTNYPVVLAAQASCVDHYVVRVVSVNPAARSWPTAERGLEGNENGNERVRVSVGYGEEEAADVLHSSVKEEVEGAGYCYTEAAELAVGSCPPSICSQDETGYSLVIW